MTNETQIPPCSFLVLLSGRLTVTGRLRDQVAGARAIAADDGMRHAEALAILPELWVGDFDSTDAVLAERYARVARKAFPAAKNDTDGGLAIAAALERGADRLVLAGALGGERSDHMMSHVMHACALADTGCEVLLTSGEEEAMPLRPGVQSFDLPAGSLFSIIGISDIHALSIAGARYPLDDRAIPFGSTRTISNVAEGTVTITLGAGRAVLLARPYDLSGA